MSKMKIEGDMAKLMAEIKNQNFQSVDEIKTFMEKMMGTNLDQLSPNIDDKSRSQDLIYEAHEQTSLAKGKKLVKEALVLDPDNADAYNYLGYSEPNLDKALILFEKAIIASEKTLGKKFFKEAKGYFWGLIETRPYMRAKEALADCYRFKNEPDKAIAIYNEMLELNPNDNQGVRYQLSTLLVGKSDLKPFEKLLKKYDDEGGAIWAFNYVLYSYKKFGPGAKSEKALMEAHESNKFVLDYMMATRKLPKDAPEFIGVGDKDEAIVCVQETWDVWMQTEGALVWLRGVNPNGLKLIK